MKLTLSPNKDVPYMVEMMQLLISKCQGDFYLGLFEAGWAILYYPEYWNLL